MGRHHRHERSHRLTANRNAHIDPYRIPKANPLRARPVLILCLTLIAGAALICSLAPAAFAQVPAGVPYGNTQRNVEIGPGFINTDLSALKTFSLWKEHSLQFRAEAFNLFNNVNLANPNVTLTSPSFGRISALYTNYSPRVIQFALKLYF